ncbi:MAG: HAD family hydrolase [Planctomycetota bacterium]|jgi:phosphoglycolate phosphatase-like HAD superfamily hydrolase
MKRLVLFDIDGTLLSTDGAAGRAFEAAMIDVYGTAGPIRDVSFAGKTDPQIAHELLSRAGVDRARIEGGLPRLWDGYLERFDAELAVTPVRVFPGVVELLEFVESRPDEATTGLLTGNIKDGARRKLDASGIGFERFIVGVFGSDREDRNELPALAVERAETLTGLRFTGKDLVIVGDTPADIACGKVQGARTVAVATGVFSHRQLEACAPDFLFDSLEDAELVWESIAS